MIERAKELVEQLSEHDITKLVQSISISDKSDPKKRVKKYDQVDLEQMTLFDTVKDDDIINELKELNLSNLTPIEALNTLYRLQNKVVNRW